LDQPRQARSIATGGRFEVVTIESVETTFETETNHGMETVFEQLFERWQAMNENLKEQAEQAWRDRRLGGGGGDYRERDDSESTRRWRLKLSVEFMLDD
jgi:hypothetical protein